MKKITIAGFVAVLFGIISFATQIGNAQASVSIVGSSPTAKTPFVSAVGADNKLYVIGYECDCLYVHDVTDKTNPVVIATTTTSTQPDFVIYNNGYVYVGTYQGVIDIFEVSEPNKPLKVGEYKFPAGYGTSKMRIANNRLFVSFYRNGFAGPGGVKILNVANPAVLAPISTINFTDNQSGGGDVLPLGDYLYVADYFGLTLRSYDISNIYAPVLKQKIVNVTEPLDYATFEPWRLLSRGDALYLLDDNIIQIYDISSPSVMWYTDTVVAYKDVEGADIIGGIMYYSSSFDHTLAWYDIKDPFKFNLIDTIVTGQNNYWTSIDSEGYVFVNSTSDDTVNIYSYMEQSETDVPIRTPLFSDQCRPPVETTPTTPTKPTKPTRPTRIPSRTSATVEQSKVAPPNTCFPIYYYYNPFVSNTSRGAVAAGTGDVITTDSNRRIKFVRNSFRR